MRRAGRLLRIFLPKSAGGISSRPSGITPARAATATAALMISAAMRRLDAFLQGDHYPTVAVRSDGMRLDAFHFLNRRVDDTAFIGIHRFQRDIPPVFQNLIRIFSRQAAQRFIPFFPIIAHIQRNTDIFLSAAVSDEARQILKRVQRFAAAADNRAMVSPQSRSSL